MKKNIYMPYLMTMWRIGSVPIKETSVFRFLKKMKMITTESGHYYLTYKGKETIKNYCGRLNNG